MMNYKGYIGNVEYDDEAKIFTRASSKSKLPVKIPLGIIFWKKVILHITKVILLVMIMALLNVWIDMKME